MASCFRFLLLFSLVISHAFLSNSSKFQDFCVADLSSPVFVDGFPCKNPNLVTADDFFFSGLDKPGNTDNPLGANVTAVTVKKLPSLNTLGISLARYDFGPTGLIPPLYHSRGTEIFYMIEGTIEVVLFDSMSMVKFKKYLNKGDVFVFPQGMVHLKFNNDDKNNAVAFSAMSSENPGAYFINGALFASNPPISDDVLVKAFQLEKKTIDRLRAKFIDGAQ